MNLTQCIISKDCNTSQIISTTKNKQTWLNFIESEKYQAIQLILLEIKQEFKYCLVLI